MIVRLEGSPLITGTKHHAPCFRCNTCQTRFRTTLPHDITTQGKYAPSAYSTLAIARYGMGLPMYRTEQYQKMHGIPMSDATQYDLLASLHNVVMPAFKAMEQYAANGDVHFYDDTPGRILERTSQNKTTHTTALISQHNGHEVHLFYTGAKNAGKNMTDVYELRDEDKQIIAMMDASPSNTPKGLDAALSAQFILCFCLAHGRRKFFEVFSFFEPQCNFVLDVIGKVYKNDAYCKENNLTAKQRLQYHQAHSKPLMDTLYIWLNNQLLYDHVEHNSELGGAIKYMQRHWQPLTRFLWTENAPLDNTWAERTIKVAIRHRKNSLFYKTEQGAHVGDVLMSIIHTCKSNDVNAYDYLNVLQAHAKDVINAPSCWLPWNYQDNLKDAPYQKAA